MKQLIVIVMLAIMSLGMAFGAQAQTEPTPAATDSAAVLQKQRLDQEIADLTNIYRGQLTEYRNAEKEFLIARDQYRQLQTLASINDVTESARKVMRLRDQVLSTYFELLRVSLIAAEGVELSLKQLVNQRLVGEQNWLQTHMQAIANVTDREEFNQLADEFTAKQTNFEIVSQEASSILAVGELQNVFDRLSSLGEDIADMQASDSAVAQSRAMRETSGSIQVARVTFQTLWAQLTTALQNNSIAGFYDDTAKTLNPVYADLNKLASFLEELLRSL